MTQLGDTGAAVEARPPPAGADERQRADARRAVRALVLSIGVIALALLGGALAAVRAGDTDNGWLGWFCLTLPLGIVALVYGRRAEAKVVDVDGPEADEQRARQARRLAVAGIALAVMLVLGLLIWNAWDGLVDVGNTFFSWENIRDSIGEVWQGFKLNILIFIVAEILVLIWGLIVALVLTAIGFVLLLLPAYLD